MKQLSFLFLFVFIIHLSFGQSKLSSVNLNDYHKAVTLYESKSYEAAISMFESIKSQFDKSSEYRANCEYYIANSAIKNGQQNGDQLMLDFVKNYPTSLKVSNAYLEVGNYYFDTGKYANALKWLSKVKTSGFSTQQEEDFKFRYAYTLFATNNITEAKKHFLPLLNSSKYGSQAKYYYGFMAYNQDNYEEATKYLTEVAQDSKFEKDVSYYLVDMNFKLGKFQKAIELGLPLLKTTNPLDQSEISKIIGESYFNLNNYAEAIPHLLKYRGKRGKWNNTDYYYLGYSYYKQKEYENAISQFNKIINGQNAVAQNAYYHLAECYLRTDKKSEALNAFKNASQMTFDEKIREDSYLNYAKLSFEIGNPYKNVAEVLQDFIKEFPRSIHKNEINDLIISSYISTKNYAGAISYLKDKTDSKSKALYQKITYLRGVQLFNENDFNGAQLNFEKSIKENIDLLYTALATFWKGEANYRLHYFRNALQDFKGFERNPQANKTNEFQVVNYHLGYSYFKLKEYDAAAEEFQKFINKKPKDNNKLNDSYLRLGDSYFASSNYWKALDAYNKAIELNGADVDYALYQKAISYGFVNRNTEKIKNLETFLNRFQKSSYRDEALYELGNTQMATNNTNGAIQSFKRLISEHSKSPFVARAMLKEGLIYYNSDSNELALASYKKVVKDFPKSQEAKEAVTNARQLYIDIGKVDEYAIWVKGLDFVSITDIELDNTTYESAEKPFLSNDFRKAIAGFQKYLNVFPNGINATKANYYLAQSFISEKQMSDAIPYLQKVVNTKNEYTETSLTILAQFYLEKSDWNNALPVLNSLEDVAESTQNRTFAMSNLMKAYFETNQISKAEVYAEKVLALPRIDDRAKADATILIARAAFKNGNDSKAKATYKEVEKIATGKIKAEALYFSAYYEHKAGNYKTSNEIVQRLAADYSAHKLWGAKGLIIMAKNFNELKDAYQANYILENVIANFSEFDEVVLEAKSVLANFKIEQSKTNESVIIENK
ncbi:MAG TPA: tetratricopeptide repeat protein [Flavobacteriaceae bacterium]|nr:tetratricopeptide repeat protein [Flavobacteriaceae bacterium]